MSETLGFIDDSPVDFLPVEFLGGDGDAIVDYYPPESLGGDGDTIVDYIPAEVHAAIDDSEVDWILPFSPTSIPSEESFGTPDLSEVETPYPPVLEEASAAQRDTSTTWLVDVDLVAHDPNGGDLELEVAYSLDGAGGPWLPATAQYHDRHHSLSGPSTIEDVAETAPGTSCRFVWNAFLDLLSEPAAVHQVHLRLTLSDGSLEDELVVGPVEVSTIEPEDPPTPAERQERRLESAGDGDFLGNGLVVPFRRSSRDFASASGIELIRACVREILLTRAAVGSFAGDLPWRPDFGSKLWVLRHRNRETLDGVAAVFVREALAWEPRVLVTDVFVEKGVGVGPREIKVRVRYRVIDQDVDDNRVLQPELEETIPI